ncbi:MAG: putative Ig domain-containing protein, partial [Xanthomonadales bacterium]
MAREQGTPGSKDDGFARLGKSLVLLPLLCALLLSIISFDLNAQSGGRRLAKPTWISSGSLSSDTGYGQLKWEQKHGEAVEMFQLKEKFDGKTSYSYVSGRELKIYRANPGQYQFRLSACVKDVDGYPNCGAQSAKLIFIVTEAIYDPYIEAANDVGSEELVAGLVASAAVAGGPDQLRPGMWYNPAKSGHGWSFYWANRLALSSNPQNAYDLYGIWYTYEAKTRAIIPICESPDPWCGYETDLYNYRPLVATMQLVQTGSNTFGGGIYISRNGTAVHAGTATITFSGIETSASISWAVDFQHESLADQETISLLVGEDSSPFGDPTDFAGLWQPTSGADYYIVDNIGTTAELVEVVFYDDDGDPVWIQAESYQTLTQNSTSLCFYYIKGGYAPDLSGSIPSNWFTGSACDFNATAGSSNRNGRRYFTDYETGRYWVNFTLPAGAGGNAPAGGSVSIGSSASPAYFSKQANFHRIYATNGNSCDISATVTSCNAVLTWFTDGDYPNGTAFAYNQTTGQRSAIATSTAPAMENQVVPLSVAGNYVFELRMTSSTGSRLIAESLTFTVNEIQDVPMTPASLNAVWTNEPNRAFNVSWSHVATQDVDYYKLEENRPDGSGLPHTVSPGSNLERDFAYLTGPFGTYRYRVQACSTASGSEVCSSFTAWLNWLVTDPNLPTTAEHPWGDNAYGALTTNIGWNYAMGYHFKAAVDGNITQLGGLFNGTKTVKLFRRGGPELASISVTANNAWSYVSIPPVAITAGVEYTVAAYLTGSGASYSSGLSFPQTFGQIEILGSTYTSTSSNPDAIPDSIVVTTTMYGQADIGFEAGGPSQEPPVITAISNQQNAEGDSPSVQVIATDTDGTVVSFSDGGSLPAGLSISNAGLISGTIVSGAAAASPYSVTITVTDNDGLTDQDTFAWTVDPAPNGQCVDIFKDDFESDRGWVRNLQSTDTAVRGLWERSNPATTTYNGVTYQLGSTPSGSYALVTDGRAGSSGYTYDVDRGPTSISSPSIDLPAGGSSYQLEFDYNFAYRSSSSSTDRFAVYAVTGSGETLLFEEVDDNSSSHAGAWKSRMIDLSAFAGQSVRIKFLADDDAASGVLVEAQVDDVRICYVPGAGNGNTAPEVIQPADQSNSVGETISPLVIQVSDAEGDSVTCSVSGLPVGLSQNSECTITGTVSAAVGDYSVSVTANDGQLDSSAVTFIWTVTQAASSSNPETPPAPAGSPNMGIDSLSSRVGATAGAFRVDESGSATFTVPIFTAPGSGGVAPQISLNYSSQGGNSILGVGGSLGGLSAITRCGQTLEQDGPGRVQGISLSATDRFCLDGQRLVAVSGVYGANGTQYRTEIDGMAKVVSSGTAGAGPAYFTVWRKDGSVTKYGNTADSRIEARTSRDLQTVLIWVQNRMTGPAGNYIDYGYVEMAGGAGEAIEFVLDTVRYTGNTRAGTAPYAQLDFIYSSDRPDATVNAVAGAMIAQSQLLIRVDSRARANAGSTLETLRSYYLAYGSDGHGRKTLESITECRDSSQSNCFAPTRFSWQHSKHEIGVSNVTVGNVFNKKHVALAMADITGDGRPDMLLTEKSKKTFRFRIATALASGGFSSPSATTYTIPNNGNSDQPVTLHTIDLNADGFQDIIYPTSNGWKGRLANGVALGSEITLSSCCGMSNPPLVRIMDFDGDGLSDLVTNRATATAGNELVLLRNGFSAANSSAVGFESAQVITIASSANLFPEQSTGGWRIVDEQPHFYGQAGNSAKFAQPFDYNGDGAVDLLVRLSQRYFLCSSGCTEPHSSTAASTTAASTTAASTTSQFIFDREPVATEQNAPASGTTYAWATFYVILVSDGGTSFVQREVVATGKDCIIYDACNPYAGAPVARRVLPADINADGLADFAYQDASYDWQARINLGGEFYPADISVASFTDGEQSRLSRFQDLNGDGYPEFIYPSAIASANAVWVVHENQFGSAFTAARTSNDKYGDSERGDASILVDVNGDGMVDNLFIDIDSRGRVDASNTRVYLGRNGAGGSTSQAVNVITRVTDGFGAQTTISFKPLTDTTVYTRMRDAKSANWGKGYAVYDLIAPTYVVSQAQSSAPLFNNAQAVSRIEYHYVGAKLQGGGRGFLGFGEVISYDPQSGIRTNTRYRQDFPFIGLPGDTTQALASSSHKFDPISNPATSTPPAWPSVNAGTAAPALGSSGTLLSYAINQWGSITTVAGQAATFPFIQQALERSYTLAGNFERKVLTSNSYTSYGDLTRVVVNTYASDGASSFTTLTTSNQYLSPDTTNWRLGRLSRSTVTHQRNGESSITRTSSFFYDAATGILDQEVIEPDNNAFKVTTHYQLDAFGNRKMTTVTAYGMTSRSSSSSFDPLGRFVVKTRNTYSQLVQKISNWDAFGNALQVENIDGVLTTSAADQMGRPFISYTRTGAWSKTIQRSGAGSYCPAGETAFYTLTTGGAQPRKYSCFDVLGRELRTVNQGFTGSMVYVDRYFDESGRLERVSEPYFAGDTRYWNRTAYDVLGRLDSVLAADGNDQTYDYDEAASGCVTGGSRQTRTTNGLGQRRLELRNVLGESISVYDNDCGAISYHYNAIGNLVNVTGADGVVITTTYDLAGRKISMNDPDKGYWQYAYNPLGELTRQRDSKNQAVDFTYDKLGRVASRRELKNVSSLTDGAYTTVNREITTWNNSTSSSVMGKGQVTKVIYREGENGAIVHQLDSSYDSFGRPALVSTSQDGLQLADETTYDQHGRVFQQFDASGDDRGIRYHYNTRGYLEKLQEAREGSNGAIYQHIQGMDARGNVTSMVLGNGVEAYATYQAQSGRIEVLEAYDAQGVELQYVTYRFDVVGNLESRRDTSQSRNLDESFSYDGLNRLEQVMLAENGGAAQSTLSLQYDASGNITYKSDVGSYLYGQNGAGPHAVTRAGGISYSYDANGNQVSGDGRTITYTVFDKATRIAKGSEYTQFSYGIGNQRIRRLDNNAIDEIKTTWYFGSTERIRMQGENAFFKRYLGGVAIADYFPSTGRQNITYLIKDHLGSIHTTVTESGLVAGSTGMSFGPFGARRSAGGFAPLSPTAIMLQNMTTTRGFTGHEHADGLGIIHMNGRIYDPKLGRFLQADPFVQSPKNSQSLNRYSYVLNNPLSYTDPSGYFSLKKLWKKIRPFAAIAITIWNPGALFLTGVWGAGTTGFIAGFVVTGTLKGAVIGAFSAAAFYGIGQHFAGVADANPKVYKFVGGSGLRPGQFTQKIAAHGIAGGVTSELQGGKFGHGFVSAGYTQALAGPIGQLKIPQGRIAAAAIVGGTASELTGGKFANGALTGAFSRAFHDERHRLRNPASRESEMQKLRARSQPHLKTIFREMKSKAIDHGCGCLDEQSLPAIYSAELDPKIARDFTYLIGTITVTLASPLATELVTSVFLTSNGG